MAIFHKFKKFPKHIAQGKHMFDSDVFKVMLTNVAPLKTNTFRSEITEIADGKGYPLGGLPTQVTIVEDEDFVKVEATQVTFIALEDFVGPFRYAVLYNATSNSVDSPLIGWWDYASSIVLCETETLTVKFNSVPSGAIFTLTCSG